MEQTKVLKKTTVRSNLVDYSMEVKLNKVDTGIETNLSMAKTESEVYSSIEESR